MQASQSPKHLIFAGRTVSKIEESIDALKAKFPEVDYRPLQLDLSSQAGVRKGASELLSWKDVPKIDILVNNAAVMLLPERTLSEDGIEMHFATNHIGHYLFTNLIMPKLFEAAKNSPKGATRVVNVSSRSPEVSTIRWSDLNFEKINNTLPKVEQPPYDFHRAWAEQDPEHKSYLPLEGYSQSKVANVLFSIGLNKRLYDKYGVLSLTLHPGVIQTELSRSAKPETIEAIGKMKDSGRFTLKTLGAGASTSLVASLDPALGPGENVNGKENRGVYLSDCQICDAARPEAISSSEAERMWQLSEQLVKEKFVW